MSLFVPRHDEVRSGSEVTLDVTVERTSLRFNLRGEVRLLLNAVGARKGMGVNFVGHQKREAALMLAACAGRAPTDGTALDSRHDVDLRCVVKFPGKRVKAAVKDVSSTGAFIGSPQLPPVRGDTELTIQLDPFLTPLRRLMK